MCFSDIPGLSEPEAYSITVASVAARDSAASIALQATSEFTLAHRLLPVTQLPANLGRGGVPTFVIDYEVLPDLFRLDSR